MVMVGKLMRVGGVYTNRDDVKSARGIRVGADGELMTRTTERDMIKLTFNGSQTPILNDTSEIRSERIDLSKYKKINFLVKQHVIGSDVSIRFTETMGETQATQYRFYDWNTDEWVGSNHTGNGKIVLPDNGVNMTYSLATHPNFYFLQELGVEIEMRVRLTQTVAEPQDTNTIEVWFVGEYDV